MAKSSGPYLYAMRAGRKDIAGMGRANSVIYNIRGYNASISVAYSTKIAEEQPW